MIISVFILNPGTAMPVPWCSLILTQSIASVDDSGAIRVPSFRNSAGQQAFLQWQKPLRQRDSQGLSCFQDLAFPRNFYWKWQRISLCKGQYQDSCLSTWSSQRISIQNPLL